MQGLDSRLLSSQQELARPRRHDAKELADSVGVTSQTIVAIEKAHNAPSLELEFLIVRVFHTPLEEVISFDAG